MSGHDWRELAALPAAQRDAVRLRIVDELSYDDLAARLGITPDNARARVSRGLRALTRAITPLQEAIDAR